MFNKNNPQNPATPQEAARKQSPAQKSPSRGSLAPSILGKDIFITGNIKTDGDVQIDGRLDGNISAGTVTVGEQGAVNGEVLAKTVHVRGKVAGKVNADKIELSETANVQADLVQDQLVIANGAFFDGKCKRKSKAPTAMKTAPAPAKA